MLKLLNSRPWTVPTTLTDATEFHASLEPLLETARSIHGEDRVARIIAIRLEVFLAHWPHEPDALNLDLFVDDVAGLVRHDIPRLRELLTWSPTELPEQRTPRLGVATLHTA